MKGRELLDAVEGGVAVAAQDENTFEVTLYDHERYSDPTDDPNSRTITVSADDVLEFFGR